MPLVSWHWNAEWQVKVMENSLWSIYVIALTVVSYWHYQ
jgi:hypothetical protein